MHSNSSGALVDKFDRLIAASSVAYQSFQLAAQQADLEGHALAAATLRSIAEGHAGKAHVLLLARARLDGSAPSAGATEVNVRAAIDRSTEIEAMSGALASEVGSRFGDAGDAGDLLAAMMLTATNKTRLENLLSSILKEPTPTADAMHRGSPAGV